MTIKETILKFLKEAEDMPDYDWDNVDLFKTGPDYKTILTSYYNDVLAAIDHPEIVHRLSECDLSGDALSIYEIINTGRHPVRDALIIINHGLEF